MKHMLFLTVFLLLTLIFSACGEQKEQFTVTMEEMYAGHDPITLTVTLPNTPKESDITFAIDGTVYTIASMPTVNDPMFVFSDIPDDGMQKIYLNMPSDESEPETLHMHPDDGTAEMSFVVTEGDFSRLTAYLGTN